SPGAEPWVTVKTGIEPQRRGTDKLQLVDFGKDLSMSIGLLLKANFKTGFFSKLTRNSRSPNNVLGEFEKWILDYAQELHPVTFVGVRDEKPTLYCRLHPAAEDLEISVTDSAEFTASANTSTVGPGYHIFVCEMLQRLGKSFKATWAEPN